MTTNPPNRVLIVGANGKIGRILCQKLSEETAFEPVAFLRNPGQIDQFQQMRVSVLLGDLEQSVEQLASAIQGVDAIIFTAGSGGQTGPDMTLLIDLDGAVKLMEAAERAGVTRFLMISALGAGDRDRWNEKIKPYYVAKHYADRALISSGLDYTILRPGRLTDDAGQGTVSLGENIPRDSVSREDVATVAIECLKENRSVGAIFDLTHGATPINEALQDFLTGASE